MNAVLYSLGLSAMMEEIISGMQNGNLSNVVLGGRSGTGKTSLAAALGNRLKESDFDRLDLRGDSGRRLQEYYPFYNLLRSRAANPGTQGFIGAVAEQLPGPLATVRRAVDMVANAVNARTLATATIVHDPIATEILTLLRGRLRRGNLVLVLDDVQAFDSFTLRLLGLIISSPQQCLGVHSHRLRILATDNEDEQHPEAEVERGKVLQSFRPYTLSRCGVDRFPDLLRAIGFSADLPLPVVNELYARSGAHLRVLAELARHVGPYALTIDFHSNQRLLDIVLTLRLSEPTSQAKNVDRVLARIAILGISFTRMELQCLLSDVPSTQIPDLLRHCIDLDLLESEGQNLAFQHGSIREFFLRIAAREHPQYHAAFANCLRLLRPSDYAARASHLESAGEWHEADVMRVLSWSRASRNGRNAEIPEFTVADSEYIRGMRNAHEYMQDGREAEAIVMLESIHSSYPPLLLAERDLTLAECYLEDVTYSSFTSALTVLEPWPDSLVNETELRARAAYLRAMAKLLTADYTQAAQQFTSLERLLAPVRQTDPGLQRLLNRIQLVSDGLHSIEVAGRRIYSAVSSLLDARSSARAFNPLDLYVALTNYSGNLLISGDYTAAAAKAGAVSQLRTEYPEFRFPSHLPALNNQLLAEMMGTRATVAETAIAFEALIANVDDLQDHLLLAANYSNLLCMTGQSSRVPELVKGLLRRTELRGDCDEYYVFYLRHVLAVALLLNASRREAQNIWASLTPMLSKLPPGLQRYLRHRHTLLSQALGDPRVRSAADWNTYLNDAPDFEGPAWRFFRQGFLFSDIQLWLHL